MNSPRNSDQTNRRPSACDVCAALLVIVAIGIGACASDAELWRYAAHQSQQFVNQARIYFGALTQSDSMGALFYPALAMTIFAVTLRLVFNQPPDWMRLPVAIVFAGLQITYLAFRAVNTLCLDTWPNAVVSVLFLISEAFIHFRIALGNLSLLRLTNRTAQADDSQQAVRAGEYLPSVDVFVPTYSEPVEMLRRTIIGCQAMDYPRKTIHLLDDQRRPAMRALAKELGCEYFDRPDNRHAKAGNLNHALPRTYGEFIVCFDADFVPSRNFIERTIGFFRDRYVAMVQTPQNFFNEDAITRNLGLENALEDEQRLFFRTLQPGRDAMNAVVCHGSCFVVRRAALDAIGGVPTETITEDWATSIKLQAAGYKILYLNEALSAGMSADKCGEFVQQRARWAQGTVQSLFASTNPLTVPGLNWKQRLMHFSGIVYYLGSVSSLFNLIAPLLFLFLGLHLLQMTIAEMIFYRLPFAVGFYALYSWLTNGTRSAMWTEFYEAFLAPSMGLTVLRSLVKPFGAGFRVTDKTIRKGRLAINRRVAFPFAALLIAHVVGIAIAFFIGRPADEPDAFAIATYFAVMNVGTLWICLLASIDVAQQTPFVRFQRQSPCSITWDDTGLSGETLSLSEGDAVFKPARPVSDMPEAVFVHLPELELHDISARVKPGTEGWILEFVDLTLPQRRALISSLFCQPRRWDRPTRSEWKAASQYVLAGVRMYPLAESP
ncbi:MAG TPA: glycosyltransferase [Verrucomicrobiae bacterium]|nr:glycosyltransferase [Verrucomicrobiae bacterium]